MARVTGIGGIFFKSRGDHTALAKWYAEHLGLQLEPFGGAILRWPDDQGTEGGSPCGARPRPRASGSAPATPRS